mmetsp:Transcript_31878/g.69615  ORF Transcript_31878/g.69615 Transcript_31878/m.69615 type:complete len:202 (+) Transcript_31878:642-1247(+)
MSRQLKLPDQNFLVYLERVLIIKRRVPCYHLIHQHSQRPPVYRLSVSLALDNFWSQVLWCPTQRPCSVCDPFSEPKVRDFENTVPIKKKILGLQVSVSDVFRVHVLQRKGDAPYVTPHGLRWEATSPPEMCKYFSPRSILHEHVQFSLVLISRVQLDYKRMLYLHKDGLLRQHVLHLLRSDDFIFFHAFQRHELPSFLVLY